jgi:hypothetical protein
VLEWEGSYMYSLKIVRILGLQVGVRSFKLKIPSTFKEWVEDPSCYFKW